MDEKEIKQLFGIKEYPQRTKLQNDSLHLYFLLLSEELNNAGYNLKTVLDNINLDIPVTPVSVKESIWRPIQEKMLGKKSTTELSTIDITTIWEALNLAFGTRMGIHVPFPSEEQTKNYLESLKQSNQK